MSSIENIESAIPGDVDLSDAERQAVLEIAYLAVAADHSIHADEEKALRAIARKLDAQRGSTEVDVLFRNIGVGLTRDTADERLRRAATGLTSQAARALAYKAAYAVSLADLASADEEFEFDLQLIDALGLPQSDVDRLTEEVQKALLPE